MYRSVCLRSHDRLALNGKYMYSTTAMPCHVNEFCIAVWMPTEIPIFAILLAFGDSLSNLLRNSDASATTKITVTFRDSKMCVLDPRIQNDLTSKMIRQHEWTRHYSQIIVVCHRASPMIAIYVILYRMAGNIEASSCVWYSSDKMITDTGATAGNSN